MYSSLKTENKKLKRENETLKLEIAELRLTVDTLQQSLDEALRHSGPQPVSSDNAGSSDDSELQIELNDAIRQLSETRKQLLNVEDQLTVVKQVTAATQRRVLVEEGADVNLPSDGDYEQLRFDPTQEHLYTALQLTTHTGCITVFRNIFTLVISGVYRVGRKSKPDNSCNNCLLPANFRNFWHIYAIRNLPPEDI